LRFSSGTFSFFAGGFDDPLKNLIFARKFKSSPETFAPPAEDLNFPRKFQIFSGKSNFSRNFSIVPLQFQISGGAPNVRLTI